MSLSLPKFSNFRVISGLLALFCWRFFLIYVLFFTLVFFPQGGGAGLVSEIFSFWPIWLLFSVWFIKLVLKLFGKKWSIKRAFLDDLILIIPFVVLILSVNRTGFCFENFKTFSLERYTDKAIAEKYVNAQKIKKYAAMNCSDLDREKQKCFYARGKRGVCSSQEKEFKACEKQKHLYEPLYSYRSVAHFHKINPRCCRRHRPTIDERGFSFPFLKAAEITYIKFRADANVPASTVTEVVNMGSCGHR